MIYIFAFILHFLGVHSERPYGRDFKDKWNEGVGENEYRCVICNKIIKEKK